VKVLAEKGGWAGEGEGAYGLLLAKRSTGRVAGGKRVDAEKKITWHGLRGPSGKESKTGLGGREKKVL